MDRPDDGSQSGFPDRSYAEWRADVEAALRGRTFEAAFVRTDGDGLQVEPLHTADHGAAPQRGMPGAWARARSATPLGTAASGWTVQQVHGAPDIAVTAEAIAEDVAGGVTSIVLRVAGPRIPDGLVLGDVDDLIAIVDAIVGRQVTGPRASPHGVGRLADPAIVLEAGRRAPEVGRMLLAAWRAGDRDPAALHAHLGLDPIGTLPAAGHGVVPPDVARIERDRSDVRGMVGRLASEGWTGVRPLAVDGRVWHDAGATRAQTLGAMLATAATYLRWLTEDDDGDADERAVARAAATLAFVLPLDVRVFDGIATVRALRLAWSRVLAACGAADAAGTMHVTALLGRRELTRRDPWVNVLRATLAAMSGGLGGADAIRVPAFDAAVTGRAASPDRATRRLARNTQRILLDEVQLNRVIDAAGGAFWLEERTQQVARAAWEWLQRIEGRGGMPEAMASGWFSDDVAEAAAARRRRVRTRARPVTGVSTYADPSLPLLERPELAGGRAAASAEPSAEAAAGASVSGSMSAADPVGSLAAGFPLRPVAEPWERLRDTADAIAAHSGHRPRAALVRIGELADHSARATWATNLLEAGGFDVVDVAVPSSDGAAPMIASRFGAASAPVALLCASDVVYGEHGPAAVTALAQAGAASIAVAGRPNAADGWEDDVDGFAYVGTDVCTVVEDLLRAAGAAGTPVDRSTAQDARPGRPS